MKSFACAGIEQCISRISETCGLCRIINDVERIVPEGHILCATTRQYADIRSGDVRYSRKTHVLHVIGHRGGVVESDLGFAARYQRFACQGASIDQQFPLPDAKDGSFIE